MCIWCKKNKSCTVSEIQENWNSISYLYTMQMRKKIAYFGKWINYKKDVNKPCEKVEIYWTIIREIAIKLLRIFNIMNQSGYDSML